MIQRTYYKTYRLYPEPDYFYIQNEYNGNNTIQLKKTGTPSTSDLEYSTDKQTWTPVTFTYAMFSITLAQGGKVYFRSTTGFSAGYQNNLYFMATNNYSAGGHIATLLNYNNIDSITSIPNGAFYAMFCGDSRQAYSRNLTSASNISFSGITSIGTASLSFMFHQCSFITTPPDFSSVISVGNYGFSNCFSECTSLAIEPNFSNVISVGDYGFSYCFQDCTSLTTAPDLSNVASVESSGLGSMFYGCTLLAIEPDLSGLTSIPDYACFQMFYNCSSLTKAPNLSNVTSVGSSGCSGMYSGCSNLSEVTAPNVSTWNTSNFNNWLYNVAASGTFKKPTALTVPEGTNGYPTGWTVQNY